MDTGSGATACKVNLFISYSRRDTDFAERQLAALEARGVEAFLDTQDIADAEAWEARLEALIISADAVAFLISPDSIASSHCRWEIQRTLELQKRIIPVLYRPVDDTDVPEELNRFQRIPALFRDVSSWDDPEGFSALVDRIVAAARTDIAWVREHTRLVALAARWHAGGRLTDQLLRRGEIVTAQSWATRRPQEAPAIPGFLSDFLDESHRFENETQARDRRRSRWLLGLAAMIIIVVTGAAVGFLQTTREANRDLSLVLATAANDAMAEGEIDRATRLASFAAHTSIVSPAADEAEPTLARAAHNGRLTAELRGHLSGLLQADFSPDGKVAFTLGDDADPTVYLWSVDNGARIGRLGSEVAQTTSIAYDFENRMIATGYSDGSVQLWFSPQSNFSTWEMVHRDELVNCGQVGTLAFAPSGDLLVSSCKDGSLHVRKLNHEMQELVRPTQKLDGNTREIFDIAFSPGGQMFSTAGRNGEVVVWDANTFETLGKLEGHNGVVYRVRFSHDGRRIVTVGQDHEARLWGLTHTGLWEFVASLSGHNDYIVDVGELHIDDSLSSYFVTTSWDGTAIFWDVSTGEVKGTLFAEIGRLHRISVDSERNIIAIAGSNGTTKVIRPNKGSPKLWPEIELKGHGGAVRDSVFSSDGRRLLTASIDGTARIWNIVDAPGTPRWQIAKGKAGSEMVGVSNVATNDPQAESIITAGLDGIVQIWSPEEDRPTIMAATTVIAPWGMVESIAFSKDSQLVAAANFSGRIRIWQRNSDSEGAWSEIAEIDDSVVLVNDISFSSGGDRIVTAGQDGMARIWKRAVPGARSWHLAAKLAGHNHPVTSAAFSPDDERVVTATAAGELTVWSLADKQEELWIKGSALPAHEREIHDISFSPDGRFLATASDDRHARILAWADSADRSSLKEVVDMNHGDAQVLNVSFSPDGERVVTAGHDGLVRVWDAHAQIEIARFSGHTGPVWSVSFSPDGRQIISVGDDLRVWDGSWLAKRPSNHALIEDVCTTLLLGSDLTGDFNNSVAGSIRRISRQDVESVSILRGRSGQDVCASRGMFE